MKACLVFKVSINEENIYIEKTSFLLIYLDTRNLYSLKILFDIYLCYKVSVEPRIDFFQRENLTVEHQSGSIHTKK